MTTSLHSRVPVYPNTESLPYKLRNSEKHKERGRIACRILQTFRMLCYFNTEVPDAFIIHFENQLESVSSEVMVMIEKNASAKEASVQTNKGSNSLFF